MNGTPGIALPSGSPTGRGRLPERGRLLALAVVLAFAVTLAVVVGQRLSDQAVAVLAGAVCGVGASIPTSLLVVWVTRRRQEQPTLPTATTGTYPPVIVVQPPPASSQPNAGYLAPYSAPAQREFIVVGGETEEARYDHPR